MTCTTAKLALSARPLVGARHYILARAAVASLRCTVCEAAFINQGGAPPACDAFEHPVTATARTWVRTTTTASLRANHKPPTSRILFLFSTVHVNCTFDLAKPKSNPTKTGRAARPRTPRWQVYGVGGRFHTSSCHQAACHADPTWFWWTRPRSTCRQCRWPPARFGCRSCAGTAWRLSSACRPCRPWRGATPGRLAASWS